MSPKGRHAKSKARINDYEKLVAAESEKRSETLELYIPPGERLGDTVIEAHGVSKAYGDKLLFENLEFSLPKGGIVGVIGPNGAGKTTLFRLITGQDAADTGDFKVGETVKLGYVDQSRDSLNADKTLFDEISDGLDLVMLGKREMNSPELMFRALIFPARISKKGSVNFPAASAIAFTWRKC